MIAQCYVVEFILDGVPRYLIDGNLDKLPSFGRLDRAWATSKPEEAGLRSYILKKMLNTKEIRTINIHK